MESWHVNDDINVLALIKGKERYIFLYDDSQRAEALRMLGRHASNPELSFSWYDAAVLSQKIRQEERQQPLAAPHAASDGQRRAVLESRGPRVESRGPDECIAGFRTPYPRPLNSRPLPCVRRSASSCST